MPRPLTDQPSRSGLVAVTLALVLFVTAAYVMWASTAVGRMYAGRPTAQLALAEGEQRQVAPFLDRATAAQAVSARPLDQALVNVAMVGEAHRLRTIRLPQWLNALQALGWRDTPAQWNRLYVAAQDQDLRTVLDVTDALLRRRQLVEQLIPILQMIEADATVRPLLVAKLAGRPAWRDAYLQATAGLTTPAQIEARQATIDALRRRGSGLTSGEALANAATLDRGGRPDLGYALWAAHQRDVSTPLNDSRFERLARQSGPEGVVPYEWSLFNGDGYSADAYVESGRSFLELNWNGRGVPIFARQRTSGRAGSYALTVQAAPTDIRDLSAIGFQLVCDGVATVFRPADADRARLVTTADVPCDFPNFEIVGALQGSVFSHRITLSSLALTPIVSWRAPHR